MMLKKYVLGLDVGISSVGWAILNLDDENRANHIVDTGVRIFTPGEDVSTGESKCLARRQKRSTRRNIRRKEFRVDRIRKLLNEYQFIGQKVNDMKVSEENEYLTNEFSKMVNEFYKTNHTNPYILKVEALQRALSAQELSIILVHYAKHRGYQSNRDDDLSNDKETGKVKQAIAENEKKLEENEYQTISELIIKQYSNKIRNTTGDYHLSFYREKYLEEIIKVLDSQIKYGVIDEEFKNKYIEIWKAQRHYAKGPGGDSKYGGNLIERMVGKCKYDGEPRAPKCAPSSELFVVLTKLLNFRYKENQDEYVSLTKEQIDTIYNLLLHQDKLTYEAIFKKLNISNATVKELNLSKKDYIKAINKFKIDVLHQNSTEKLDFKNMSMENKEEFNKIKNKIMNKTVFVELKNYSKFRKVITTQLGKDKWEEIANNFDLLDKISEVLTNYKTPEDIIGKLKENNINPLYHEAILSLPNFTDHIQLSLNLVKKLIPLMFDGHRYDESMSILFPNYYDSEDNTEKKDLLIPINQDNELTNQRVIRSLSQTRKLINAIIKKYGLPYQINIETARELAKSYQERKEILRNQEEKKIKNIQTKEFLCKMFPNKFKNVDSVKSIDLLKYNLWKEQNEYCVYSLEPITIEELFDKNCVQIDHILPYSRTFDDSYFNKTLVKTKSNQEKGNKTPYEWLKKTEKWKEYKKFINSLNICTKKKDNYLLIDLTEEISNQMRSQNLNDTKYIARYLSSYIKAHLNVKKVLTVSGAVTAKFRGIWGLNGLTHSLESADYYSPKTDKKNRENHLHHAMDALVIATITPSLIQRITSYEKYARYVNYMPLTDLDRYSLSMINDKEVVSLTSGEIIEIQDLKEYIKELRKEEYITNKRNTTISAYFPKPYPTFVEEAKIRVYEQNIEIAREKLKELGYTTDELNQVYPIIPSIAKPKMSGALHKDTYYGIRKVSDEKTFITSRISVITKNFDKSKLDTIIDSGAGSKEVRLTLEQWLNGSNGEVAYKEKGYPINSKTGNLIKKITVKRKYDNTGHILKNKLVEKSNIYQIRIFKNRRTNIIYYSALDLLDIKNIERYSDKRQEFNLILWDKLNSYQVISYIQIQEEFELLKKLNKGDLVHILDKNGYDELAYLTGFSSGKLEIKSKLGDSYDLIGESKIYNKFPSEDRYRIPITKIAGINRVKISILGKIESWDIDKLL